MFNAFFVLTLVISGGGGGGGGGGGWITYCVTQADILECFEMKYPLVIFWSGPKCQKLRKVFFFNLNYNIGGK